MVETTANMKEAAAVSRVGKDMNNPPQLGLISPKDVKQLV